MADDDRRVEPRSLLVGRGAGTTPERIAEIEKRRADLEKIGKTPTVAFSQVLAAKTDESADAAELSQKEQRMRALPKRGPKPSLVHPSQRDVYGREENTDEAVVLKG